MKDFFESEDWSRLEHDLNVGIGSIIIFSFIVMLIIEIAI